MTFNSTYSISPDLYYQTKHEMLKAMYYKNDGDSNIFHPNGFASLPHNIYSLFDKIIDRPGKLLDLGCGNGLLLKYLMGKSQYSIIPYGVDFIASSIYQAKNQILKDFSQNFEECNILDYKFQHSTYDFILFDPYALHPAHISTFLNKMINNISLFGKLICYTYRDVLNFYSFNHITDFIDIENDRFELLISNREISIAAFTKKDTIS